VTEKFKSLWKDGPDIFDGVDPDEAAPSQDYLHVNMAELAKCRSAVAMTWARILQLCAMRPKEEWHVLGMAWFDHHGRRLALRQLEKWGLICVQRFDYRNPRIKMVKRKRAKNAPQGGEIGQSRGQPRPP
jgi:hypothetical protein